MTVARYGVNVAFPPFLTGEAVDSTGPNDHPPRPWRVTKNSSFAACVNGQNLFALKKCG
jgi:hypothetical protein